MKLCLLYTLVTLYRYLPIHTSSFMYCISLHFSPVVRIGPPARPLTRKRVLPPFVPRGGTHSLGGESGRGGGEPIRTKGHTLWYSRYNIIRLRCEYHESPLYRRTCTVYPSVLERYRTYHYPALCMHRLM